MIVQSLWKGTMCIVDGQHVATISPCIRKVNPTPRFIIKQVAAQHGLSPEDLSGPARFRPIVHARQEAMYRLRNETKLSAPQIGRSIGGRDHTTVLYGVKAHAERISAQ